MMELIIETRDDGLYMVIVKSAKGKTIRKFVTSYVDHIGGLTQEDLEQEVNDGLI